MEIREYFDSLVEEGVLNEDYSLNEEYEFEDEDEEEFVPEMGEQYWDNGFVEWMWDDDFSRQCNLLKIESWEVDPDPVVFVREIIGYEFVNENLLRQAFTRRAFAVQYGIEGCSEELEFLGDSVLNVLATRVIVRELMWTDVERPEAPFGARRDGYDEGVLSKIRSKFVCKEYLAGRAEKLGLDQFILYGGGEQQGEGEEGSGV